MFGIRGAADLDATTGGAVDTSTTTTVASARTKKLAAAATSERAVEAAAQPQVCGTDQNCNGHGNSSFDGTN